MPFLDTYCLECHSGRKSEAELDLSTLTSLAATMKEPRWGLMLDMLESEDMPAADADAFPTPESRGQVVSWFRDLRAREIARHAGDPGLVPARRLSNAEFNYTIRDLTGVDIRPTREFPVDPQNPAGFDNSGESLTMSPSLLKKYLGAAREVASHAYLHADGLGFAPHVMASDTDRDKFCVHRIIDFYHRQNTSYADYFAAAWRYKHRAALGKPTATLASVAADAKVSAKYLATLWDVFEGPRETIGPIARIQARWRALPAPGPKGEDTAVGGREALRGYIETVRAKIEPRFRNLVAPGVNAAQQPFMIWKNVQYATHRMRFDPAQLQVDGEARPAPVTGAEPGNNQFGPGPTVLVNNAAGDPDLVVPAGERPRYEAAFARFARVFPDMFYMQERGRHYFNRTADRGRYLDAGFHSLMGYFRDDQPLYELVLDAQQQKQLDALWLDMDVVAGVTGRMYSQFIENQTSQGGGRGRVVMPPNPNGDLVTSQPRIKAIEAAYLAAAEGGGEQGRRGDPPLLRLRRRAPADGRAGAPRGRAVADRRAVGVRRSRLPSSAHGDGTRRHPRRLCPGTPGRPRSRRGGPRIAGRRARVARLPLSPRSAAHRPGRRAAVRRRPRQPTQLLPLVEHAGRRAAGARRGRRSAPARRDDRPGPAHAEGSAGPRPGGGVRRQLAGHPPLRGHRDGRSRRDSRRSPTSCAPRCSRSRCACSST